MEDSGTPNFSPNLYIYISDETISIQKNAYYWIYKCPYVNLDFLKGQTSQQISI